MVQKLVLDASAMLVLIQGETGWKRVAQAMENGAEILVSSVNRILPNHESTGIQSQAPTCVPRRAFLLEPGM